MILTGRPTLCLPIRAEPSHSACPRELMWCGPSALEMTMAELRRGSSALKLADAVLEGAILAIIRRSPTCAGRRNHNRYVPGALRVPPRAFLPKRAAGARALEMPAWICSIVKSSFGGRMRSHFATGCMVRPVVFCHRSSLASSCHRVLVYSATLASIISTHLGQVPFRPEVRSKHRLSMISLM